MIADTHIFYLEKIKIDDLLHQNPIFYVLIEKTAKSNAS
jgi:hypothetical protein